MHQALKTTYKQDISLLARRSGIFWYALLIVMLLLDPAVCSANSTSTNSAAFKSSPSPASA